MKKWLIRILILLVLAIISFAVYLEIEKNEIAALLVEDINQNFNATITHEDISTSFLRTIPKIYLELSHVDFKLKDTSIHHTLLSSQKISVGVNLIDLFKESITVKDLSIEEPSLQLITYEDGRRNYDVESNSINDNNSALQFFIEKVNIDKGDVAIINRSDGYSLHGSNFHYNGALDYQTDSTFLNGLVKTKIDLKSTPMTPSYQFDFNADMALIANEDWSNFKLHRSNIKLNDLSFLVDGIVLQDMDNYTYSFKVQNEKTSFKSLASLIPAFYANDYEQLKSEGVFELGGTIKGNSSANYPLYSLSGGITNGSLEYPAYSKKIENVNFNFVVENTSELSPFSSIQVKKGTMDVGSGHINGDVNIASLNDRYNIDLELDADIDLSEFNDIIPLQRHTFLGKIDLSVDGNTTFSSEYEQLLLETDDLRISLAGENLDFKSNSQQVQLNQVSLDGTVNQIIFEVLGFKAPGIDGLNMNGQVQNALASLSRESSPVSGEINIKAKHFDFNQFIKTGDSSIQQRMALPKTLLDLGVGIDTIVYEDYTLIGLQSSGILNSLKSNFDFTIQELQGSSINGSVELSNLMEYAVNGDSLMGKIKASADRFFIDKYITQKENGSNAHLKDVIPGNIDIDLDFTAEELVFKNLNILSSIGNVGIKNQTLSCKTTGALFGGQISFETLIDYSEENNYELILSLELGNLTFQETANKTRIFNELVPIAKMINGTYSANLKWNSILDEAFIPDLTSVSAVGSIETSNGSISGSLPIDSFIREFVPLDFTREIQIEDAKRFFVIEDGQILVKDIDLRKGDIAISLSGSHGFDQTLNYLISIDIPSNKLNLGQLISKIKNVPGETNTFNVLDKNMDVQLIAHLGGELNQPVFQLRDIRLRSGSESRRIEDIINAEATNILDSIDTSIKQVVDSTKISLQNQIDSLSTRTDVLIDSSIVSLEELLKARADTLNSQIPNVVDSAGIGSFDSIQFKIEEIFNKKKTTLDSLKLNTPKKNMLFKKTNN